MQLFNDLFCRHFWGQRLIFSGGKKSHHEITQCIKCRKTKTILFGTRSEWIAFLKPNANECTRSHPHEEMNADCEAATIAVRAGAGFGLLHDARKLRNGKIQLMDIRKKEGSNAYIDIVARRPITLDEIIRDVDSAWTKTHKDIEHFFHKRKDYQITNLAYQNILWGEKWPANEGEIK